MASAPSPPSIRSRRRESAHTSSLARERKKGKEVIRLTPGAKSGNGHRRAPVRRWNRRQAPHRPVAADVRRLILHPWPASKGRKRSDPAHAGATSGHGHRPAPSPKMASAPSPPSIRSSRRESAHTSSLAREQRKGKEVIRLTPDATSGHGHRQAPAPKMASAPNPPSIRSSRRESAHTSSLAREQWKGKEVIRLTPDATSGHGHRQAPAPKMASAPSPPSIRSSRRESAHTSSLARERRKGKEVIRLTPDATSGHGHRQAPARRRESAQGPPPTVTARRTGIKPPPGPRRKWKG